MPTIYVCDDETDILRYLDKLLSVAGYRVETFSRGTDLLARLGAADRRECDTILLDVRMPDMDGLQVLEQVHKRFHDLPVVIMTAHGTIDDAVQAIKLGAYDYIMKPFPREKLLGVLKRLLDHRRLACENRQLREELQRGTGRSDSIVFQSTAFREVYDLTLQVAESDVNTLIMGESGTGKELIANALHRNSPRRGKPFVSLNCAALSDTLLESQLFGHVRGAFTGAVINQKGLVEEADGGTLFLDEIGDVSPAVQAKLLRVIQEKDFIAVGSTRPRKADVRFVAATNKDLMTEVQAGRFREDLYYRLNVISINLPPLRERREDIEPLARHFLDIATRRMKKDVRGIDDDALGALLRYDWPGNVRELENVMERAVILARNGTISASLLPLERERREHAPPPAPDALVALEEVERRHIETVLRQTGFHKSRSAEILGISRKTLDRKIVEYGMGDERGA
ncbi:sigma-54 dependent transcriptional regulator [Geobacter sp. SVR]|uniref:sigma-54-dependent transcriptional regulator n=1 Tax=Geobacter sp. SVR TaxID=2495594 RepID=UPI00143F02C3|nr:sigma-54 dependent transcriptional regulator [Geobacter sp. SVR]BCS52208.1 sigma-54-dependent Fis family transcriptional regulator [Geobacter sp. SVR]GCF85130.1 sigma-54-dependent Fis family transcriptional regulator [Geobacter sp. SVR]